MSLCSELILDLITHENNYSRLIFTGRNMISKVVACFLWVLLFLKWLLLSLASTFHQRYPSALVTLPALAHAHTTALHTELQCNTVDTAVASCSIVLDKSQAFHILGWNMIAGASSWAASSHYPTSLYPSCVTVGWSWGRVTDAYRIQYFISYL